MRLDKRELYFLPISAIPFAGGVVYPIVVVRRLRDFVETLVYVSMAIPLFTASDVLLSLFYFRSLIYVLIGYSIAAPIVSSYALYRLYENVNVSVNEYYIEVNLKIPINNAELYDMNALFEKVFNKALKKLKNPYYYYKLKALSNCSNLKVTLSENKITLRKRCGDIVVEVNISNNTEAQMKVSISY
ncbi:MULTISPECIES: hypothetical protein [Acidianus]|uniref:Uncharacterized protein n=1 Tax=Candidatus Acidianus copahuensis TaxID=1160895 RepID=A0A031LN81_9CREN|nr:MULTISPECIES: hypothetical protein [Acidianus]EZQ04865.1 hypothetical protein CM19_07740 [Candidatus Acidianus copahuensis]NON63173.1 hypothetical protein [Acidianus sp. RZ1]